MGQKRKKYLSNLYIIILTAILSLFSLNTIFASSVSGNSNSTIWLDVVEIDPDTRISVTVPMAFAFVVNGSATLDDPISADYILLPNAKVVKNDDGTYSIQRQGTDYPYFTIQNFSTTMSTEDNNNDPSKRQGLGVKINPYIKNTANDKGWSVKKTDDTLAAYQYSMKLSDGMNEYKFLTDRGDGVSVADDASIAAETANMISVAAPQKDQTYVDNLATFPTILDLEYILSVGGNRKDYTNPEASAQVGLIEWNIYQDKIIR